MTVTKPPPEPEKVTNVLSGVAQLYEDNLRNYGQTSKSVGWKDEASQILRFKKLAEVIDTRTAADGISVNDLGCGYGAMFKFLDEQPRLKLDRYYGYDISNKMLDEARRAVANDPRAVFFNGSEITEEADYSFVSGSFNVRLTAENDAWTEHVLSAIRNLAVKSRRGFAFNLLTTYVDWKADNLYYADPFFFFDFCKRNLSRYVTLVHDYPLFEWTLIVTKESRAE